MNNEIPNSNKGNKLPLTGALFTGGLASACCVGPLIVVLLGMGGAASGFAFFEPLRPYFIVLTLAFLGWGWRAYQKGKKQCGAEACKPISPLFFWSVVSIVLLLLFSPTIIGLFVS